MRGQVLGGTEIGQYFTLAINLADGKNILAESIFKSKYIYERLGELRAYGNEKPLEDESALWVFQIASQFLWENPTSALLLAGWVTLAPICGALRWRPHLAHRSSRPGKSAILDRYIAPLLGDVQLAVVNNTRSRHSPGSSI